jgi:uncharacterized membrane protein YgcG
LFLTAALFATPVLAEVPNPPPLNGKPVVDAANIIPEAEESALVKRLLEIEKTTKHQVVVLTTSDMGGYDIQDYGLNAGRFYGLGSKHGDNGVLLTVAPNQRTHRIDVGYGLEAILTDGRSFEITEGMKDEFRAGDFAGGILEGVEGIAATITPMTPEQLALAQREAAKRKAALAATKAKVADFFIMLTMILALAAAIFGLYWTVTGPERRRKHLDRQKFEAERARIYREQAAAARKHRDEEFARKRAQQIAREKAAAEERERMLDAMSPSKRAAFLAAEEAAEREAREAAARAEEKRRAAEAERRARRRREDESRSAATIYGGSSYSSSSSSSSDSSFSGGGGSFGGGGSSSDW